MGVALHSLNVEKVKSLKLKDLFSDDLNEENNEDNSRQPLEPEIPFSTILSFTKYKMILRSDKINKSTQLMNIFPLPMTRTTRISLSRNTTKRSMKSFRIILFRSKLNNNNLKIFRQRREALKVPKGTQNAEYDGWSLVEGERRPEFNVELFLRRHKKGNRHMHAIDRLRDLVGLRVMAENDPIKADEVSNNEKRVMGVVTQFFKQASKRIKLS